MVAPCGAGLGVVKPGFGRATVVTAAAAEALVAEFLSPAAAIVMAPIIAAASYDLLNLCAAGDPGDPVLTAGDFVDALANLNVIQAGAAWDRIHQWFVHMMWPTWCDCSNGVIPPAPTTAVPPAPNVNPGLPAGPVGRSCWDVTRTFLTESGQFTYFNALAPKTSDLGAFYPAGEQPQLLATPIPTSLDLSVTTSNLANSTDLWATDVEYVDNTGAVIGGFGAFSPSLSGNRTYTFPTQTIPAAAKGLLMLGAGPIPHQSQFSYTVHLQLYCGTDGPLTPVTPCCPPDPLLEQRLGYLIQLAHANIALTGQSLKGHVDGTRHAALSGSGTVTLVDSVLAIRVEIKTGLSSLQLNPGSPNYYFSAGFVTPIAAGSPLKGARLVYAAQTYPVPSYTDQVGFTLPPGVSVDIIELLPAP